MAVMKNSGVPAAGFELFSTPHMAALAIVVAAAAMMGFAGRRLRSRPRAGQRVGLVLGLALLLNEAIYYVYSLLRYGFDVNYDLPLHLCDVTMFVAIAALLFRQPVLFEFAYFFGIGGATQALITPDLALGFTDYGTIKFFVSHGGILAGVLYLMAAFALRPYPKSILRIIIAGNLYLVLAALFNLIARTNYGYLRHKPDQATLLDHLGPWPWYIGALELIGLATVLVLYFPFLLYDWHKRSKSKGVAGPGSAAGAAC